MNIAFKYEEGTGIYDHFLTAKSADGVEIRICFERLDASAVYIGERIEDLDVNLDDLKGLYMNFGNGLDVQILPVSEIIRQANEDITDIVREGDAEDRAWSEHVESYRHPSL